MYVWLGSLLFYFYIYSFCCGIRWLLHRFVPRDPAETVWLAAVFEILGTLQVVAPVFDVDIIYEAYGLIAVFFQVLLLEWINWRTITDAFAQPAQFLSFANTAHLRREWLSPLACGQLFGGLLAYPMALLFWKLSIVEEHTNALERDCSSDLTVSVLNGCIVECVGTFLVRYFELRLGEHRMKAFFNSLFTAFLLVFGFHLTGFYTHPIMASVLTLGCGNLGVWPHFKVYWIAPLLGWYGAELVYAVKTEPPRTKHSYE